MTKKTDFYALMREMVKGDSVGRKIIFLENSLISKKGEFKDDKLWKLINRSNDVLEFIAEKKSSKHDELKENLHKSLKAYFSTIMARVCARQDVRNLEIINDKFKRTQLEIQALINELHFLNFSDDKFLRNCTQTNLKECLKKYYKINFNHDPEGTIYQIIAGEKRSNKHSPKKEIKFSSQLLEGLIMASYNGLKPHAQGKINDLVIGFIQNSFGIDVSESTVKRYLKGYKVR